MSLTTDCDLLGAGGRQVDDVGHLLQELFGLVQQLQNVSGMKSLCGGNGTSPSK